MARKQHPHTARQYPSSIKEIMNKNSYFKQDMHRICCSKDILHVKGKLTRPVRCPQSIRNIGTVLYEYKRIYTQGGGSKQQQ